MPDIPQHVEEIIKSFTKNKLPHFFKYAKDKEVHQVSELNNSTVNKLYSIIPNKPIQFKKLAGKFNHRKLMKDPDRKPNQEVVDKYIELNKSKKLLMNSENGEGEFYFYKLVKEELRKINSNLNVITDSLIHYLYTDKSRFKTTLWNTFGDIIYQNLENNLIGTKSCNSCSTRFETLKNNEFYCEDCKYHNIQESKIAYRNAKKMKK